MQQPARQLTNTGSMAPPPYAEHWGDACKRMGLMYQFMCKGKIHDLKTVENG
jgi:hypothetical protein